MMFKKVLLPLLAAVVVTTAGCTGSQPASETTLAAESSAEQSSSQESSTEESESTDAATSQESQEEITITDQLGREVTVSLPVERVVCLQHHTLDIMLELQAQDQIVGVMKSWENLLGSYVADVFPDIRTMPAPGELKEANVEELMNLSPDVVFASNQLPEATLDQLEELGIPVIVITLYVADREQASTIHPELVNPDEAYTEGLKQAIEIIAKVTGKEERGQELWDYVMSNRSIVAEHLETIPEEERIKVYMANEDMKTYGTGKYVGVAMAKAGAKNVAETINGYQEVTIEQIMEWDPEVIFVQSRYADVLEEIKTDERWSTIDAVKNNRLIIAPDYSKPWGNPAPESIALGELWLAKTLYPEAFEDVDLDQMVSYFYEHFYGIEYVEPVIE